MQVVWIFPNAEQEQKSNHKRFALTVIDLVSTEGLIPCRSTVIGKYSTVVDWFLHSDLD